MPTRTMRSRLEPMNRVARMLSEHRPLILNWFRARGTISAGIVEGFNNKAKLTTKKAYGFRTYEAIEIALYHQLGDLPEPHFTHNFWSRGDYSLNLKYIHLLHSLSPVSFIALTCHLPYLLPNAIAQYGISVSFSETRDHSNPLAFLESGVPYSIWTKYLTGYCPEDGCHRRSTNRG
jgi:hypothetical protein